MKLFSLRPFFCPRGILVLIVSFWKNRLFYFLQPEVSDVPQMGCVTQGKMSILATLCCHLSWGQGQSDRMGPDPTTQSKGRASGLNQDHPAIYIAHSAL